MGGEKVLIGTLQQLVEHVVQADVFAAEHLVQAIGHVAAVFLEPFGGFFLGGGFGQILDLSQAVGKLGTACAFAALVQLVDGIKQGAPILAACNDDVVVDLVHVGGRTDPPKAAVATFHAQLRVTPTYLSQHLIVSL